MRKFIIMSFSIFLLLINFISVEARDYSLPSSEVTFQIQSDGNVLVHEKIEYILNGCFTELYLSKPADLVIYNASGSCENAQSSFRTEEPSVSESGGRELILSLLTNNCDSHPTAHFYYEIHPILLCQDTARFYYQCWGMEWEKPTDLTVTIIFPEAIEHKEYYIHPWDLPYSLFTENDTTIIFKSKQDPGVPFEIDLLLPKDIFENSLYVTTSDCTRESVISFEENSNSDAQVAGFMLPILSIVIAIFPILFFTVCYVVFGRERKVSYMGIYEREPPSEHTPAEVSGLLNQFRIPPSAFIATILDFVYKGYFEMTEETIEKPGIIKMNTVHTLVFTKKKNPEKLKPHEQQVYDYVCQNMTNGSVSLETLKQQVSLPTFAGFFLNWKKAVLLDLDKKKYLKTKGVTIFTIGSAVFFIVCLGLLLMQVPKTTYQNLMVYSVEPMLTWTLILGSILSVIGLIIANIWKTILSRWTEEGRLLELKWKNFKKFISDFTLLKEHPPDSLILWDFYLVYAVALGVAENTIKAMRDIVPDEEIKRTRTGPLIYTTTGFISINRFTSSVYSSSSGGGGSGGSSGGFHGGGGGGGGAR